MNIKDLKLKNILFYGAVFVSLVIIGYFLLNPKSNENINSTQSATTSLQESSKGENLVQADADKEKQITETTESVVSEETTVKEQDGSNSGTQVKSNTSNEVTKDKQTSNTDNNINKNTKSSNLEKQVETKETEKAKNNSTGNVEPTPSPKAEPTAAPIDAAISIAKKDITSEAKFYPYEFDSIKMEVIAVKAGDGTIRTALNTCQICFDSGKGYYEQVGEFLVCQNCGNRFHIDQIEIVKGGCNPVPILETDKIENKDSILISKEYLESKKELFSNWQK